LEHADRETLEAITRSAESPKTPSGLKTSLHEISVARWLARNRGGKVNGETSIALAALRDLMSKPAYNENSEF